MTTKISDYIQTQQAAEDLLRRLTSKDFYEFLKPQFEAVPEVDSIRWTQYTPYFMDGDPCIFSTNIEYTGVITFVNPSVRLEDTRVAIDYDNPLAEGDRIDHHKHKSIEADILFQVCRIDTRTMFEDDLQALITTMYAIPDALYLALFGDHAEVELDRTGQVTINVCDHD